MKGQSKVLLKIISPGRDNMIIYLETLMIDKIENIKLPTIGTGNKYKNCSVTGTEFTKTCSELAGTKRPNFLLKAYSTGFYIVDESLGHSTGGLYKFGNPPVPETNTFLSLSFDNLRRSGYEAPSHRAIIHVKPKNELFHFTISSTIIKALAKIGPMAGTGTIKLLADHHRVLQIIAPLGHMGTLKVYIRDPAEAGHKT